ncbi:MAG: hypothetical protein WA460_09485 [Nitrososphaeraceae archaeon]|jgi:hypothetical protein
MLFLEIAGPSVGGFFAVTELPYLQKKEFFVIRAEFVQTSRMRAWKHMIVNSNICQYCASIFNQEQRH